MADLHFQGMFEDANPAVECLYCSKVNETWTQKHVLECTWVEGVWVT